MYFTPLSNKERIDWNDKQTGEARHMFKQAFAWHSEPETPEAMTLMASGHFADFIVEENSTFKPSTVYLAGPNFIRKDQRGRPVLGRLDFTEVK